MGRKHTPGFYKRGEIWHIDKQVRGRRLCESTGTSTLAEAEAYLARRIEEVRQATIYGVRPKRTFRQAATKYLQEATKATIAEDAMHLKMLDPYIGALYLDQIHMGTLQPFIAARRAQEVNMRTINYGLQTVRHILFLAAGEWLDEHGLTWLANAPRIKFLPETIPCKALPGSITVITMMRKTSSLGTVGTALVADRWPGDHQQHYYSAQDQYSGVIFARLSGRERGDTPWT